MMAPAMPHIAEELWQDAGTDRRQVFKPDKSIHVHPWPKYDAELAKADTVTLVVQVNGKVRDRIEAPAGITEDQARELALGQPARPEVDRGQAGAQGDLCGREAD